MSIRKLKFHEKKLLKKVDFLEWGKKEKIVNRTLRVYQIRVRSDYDCYVDYCKEIHSISEKLQKLDPKDPFRIKISNQLLEKLYQMGLITTKKNLGECVKIIPDSFARRRLPVMLVRLGYINRLSHAINLVEQGQVRIGPQVVTDPAFLVTKYHEDFISWSDDSTIRQTIDNYNLENNNYDMQDIVI
eukprot:TRINITY_DN3047_c0_g1_i1.p1 TRINITY_DN3047_c0_g1~~TRINITY_DN3047_c0_g1_i1.p1  ORF type:complete len:187 (-),score=29.92 TRINITY_DN3047_c0_g1_i1:71-631(-)